MISIMDTPPFWLALERAHTAMSALIAADLASVDIRRRDVPILRCIAEMDNPAAIAIADALGVPRSTISRSRRRLERAGIVALRPGELFDARSIRITLTAEGERVVALLRGDSRHIDAFLLSPRAARDAEVAIRLLEEAAQRAEGIVALWKKALPPNDR